MPRRSLALWLACCVAGAALAGVGGERFPAVQASDAAPIRQALIVAPDASVGGAFGRDALAYRDLLRLLGFEVTVVASESRPALDAALRDFADAVRPDADVAVFLLGTTAVSGTALVVLPPSAPLPPDRNAVSDYAGIRVARLLHGIRRQAPRNLVLLVDGCPAGEQGPVCPTGPDSVPDGESAIMAGPARPSTSTTPGSVGQVLLAAMTKEGLTFAELADALRRSLADTGLGIVGTARLTRTFAFLPADFLARLPRACNGVDPHLSAVALRDAAPLQPLVADCETAARVYAPWPFFKTRLAAATEEWAAQKALAGCDQGAVVAYLAAYPAGHYRAAVAEQRRTCAPPSAPAPAPAPQPPPLPAPPPLAQRGLAAAADYYQRHNYQDGDSFAPLANLYPPTFRNRQTTMTNIQQLRDLGTYYGKFDSVRIDIVPGSLDLGDCGRADNCRVRGVITSQTLKKGEIDYVWTRSRFSLLLDLDAAKVLYECAVGDPPNPRELPCE